MAFGAGPNATPLPIGVELFYSGGWQPITADVVLREPITLTRGRGGEGNTVDPGTLTFVLDNRAGKYSPRNPASPLYGLIGRNTPIRVWVEHGEVALGSNRHYRFYGEVAEWPQRWTAAGEAYTTVEASGILRRLGQGAPLARSAMRYAVPKTSPVTAYWPCEDGKTATYLTPDVGGRRGEIYGVSELAAYDGFICSDPIPVLGTGRIVLPVPPAAVTNQWMTRFLCYLPASGTPDGAVLARTRDSRFGYADLIYRTVGALELAAYSFNGTLLNTTTPVVFGVNGKMLQYQVQANQDGPNIHMIMATLEPGVEIGTAYGMSVLAQTVGRPTSVEINPTRATMTGVAVGHVLVDDQVVTIHNLAGALRAFSGDRGTDRIYRLCFDAGIPSGFGAYEDSSRMGPQGRSDLVSLLAEAATVDGGLLTESPTFAGIWYWPLQSLLSQTPQASIPFGPGGRIQLEPTDDDRATRNQVTVTRTSGASATVTQATGPLGVNTIGLYDEAIDLPLLVDDQALQQAGWRLGLGTIDEARWPSVSLNLANPHYLLNPALTRNLLLVDVGSLVEITGLPAWLPPDPVRGLVVGIRETIEPFSYKLDWVLVPAAPYRVATWDAAGDRWSPVGSTLAAGVTAGGTSLSVAWQATRWTTAAGDRPFTIVVGGETMTVTNVTGTTSPQTFTVTRSVNGISKAHSAGAAVELADPVRWGL